MEKINEESMRKLSLQQMVSCPVWFGVRLDWKKKEQGCNDIQMETIKFRMECHTKPSMVLQYHNIILITCKK